MRHWKAVIKKAIAQGRAFTSMEQAELRDFNTCLVGEALEEWGCPWLELRRVNHPITDRLKELGLLGRLASDGHTKPSIAHLTRIAEIRAEIAELMEPLPKLQEPPEQPVATTAPQEERELVLV